MSLTLLWSKWLWMDETLPSYVLLLICMLHSALCISLTRHLLFFYVIYISLGLHLWVSLAASECLWHAVSHSVCVFVCIFLCEPPHCISLYLYRCLWVCCGWHAYLILHFPLCSSLPLSFCACGYGLFVSVCVFLLLPFMCASLSGYLVVFTFLCLFLCSARLWERRQTREAPVIHALSQTQSVSEKT